MNPKLKMSTSLSNAQVELTPARRLEMYLQALREQELVQGLQEYLSKGMNAGGTILGSAAYGLGGLASLGKYDGWPGRGLLSGYVPGTIMDAVGSTMDLPQAGNNWGQGYVPLISTPNRYTDRKRKYTGGH